MFEIFLIGAVGGAVAAVEKVQLWWRRPPQVVVDHHFNGVWPPRDAPAAPERQVFDWRKEGVL